MTLNKDHKWQFLKNMAFFDDWAEDEIGNLLDASKIGKYKKGEPLFHQSDSADRLFVVMSGWIKLFRMTESGDEAIVALFTRGDLFGEAAIFTGAGYPFSAVAAEESQLIEVPAAFIKNCAAANPQIMTRIMKSMSREMHKLELENEHMSLMSTPQRVGCLLLQLTTGMIGKGGTFTFPYDKSLAAQRLGMKPETFSRALSQLKPLGVTVKGPEVRIDSFHCLSAYVCGHCSAEFEDCKGAIHRSCQKAVCTNQS